MKKSSGEFMRYGKLIPLCVLLIVFMAGCGKKPSAVVTTTEEYDPYASASSVIAVIKAIDMDEGTMSFLDIDSGKQYDLLYNNGVDVRNKYNEIMSGTMLSVGQIVDITYNTKNSKLLEIAIDSNAWEIREISGFTFDRAKHQVTILNRVYQYTNDLIVYSAGKLIADSEVCQEDQLTARGYGGKLVSLTVDLGHGYVKLEDYDTYIGGMIEIGYDVIVPVTENMLLTVREGNYKLKITKGSNSGYKSISVTRDQEDTVSLKELQIAPDSVGSMYFDVTPAEARVMIDGETIDTSETIELTYGRHHIRVTADGYESKEGYFTVDSAYKIMTIELSSEDEEDTDSTDVASTTSTSTAASTSTTEAGSTSTATTEAGSSATTESASTTEAATTEVTSNKVKIEKPVGAYCYVDGSYVGTVPCSFAKTVGSHVVTFSMKGCLTKSYTIQCLNDGKDDSYSFDALEPYESALFD
jgi:hypothetical protein